MLYTGCVQSHMCMAVNLACVKREQDGNSMR